MPFRESVLRGIPCSFCAGVPFSEMTSFRIGGKADAVITVETVSALCALLTRLRQESIPYLLLGGGTNILAADEGFRGAVIRLSGEFSSVARLGADTLRCGAGVPLPVLSRKAGEMGLSGLEFACGIPGSAGGGLFMNAGAYGGELSFSVTQAEIWRDGECITLPKEELGLSYRHSALMETGGVILNMTLRLKPGDSREIRENMAELMRKRREKQPLEYPSAGSFFKRPPGYFAGALIDSCGLRGYRVGDAQISEKHAGFVVNRASATCDQVKRLEYHVRQTVLAQTGVLLCPEVRLIGDRWLN